MSLMARKYGKKASEKIARTMHEFKRGKLRSGSGGKVTSRQQAVAIGLSQARRAGYKVPPQQGHAAMSLDTRVRAYLNNMQPGTEVDARGVARALGGIDPLEADYALERAAKAGLVSTSDGRWFGPVAQQTGHARKKQLDREIAEALVQAPSSSVKLKDRHSGGHAWLTVRGGRVVGVMGSDPSRYMGMTLDEARHHARYGGRGRSSHSTVKYDSDDARHSTVKYDRDDARMFGRYARRMEQTRAQALVNARAEGFGAHHLGAVEEGWEAECSDTIHGGSPSGDSSHATRRRTKKRGNTVADVSHARRRARAPRVTPYRINRAYPVNTQ